MKIVSLSGSSSYLPEQIIKNDFFGTSQKEVNKMFKGVEQRRHVTPDQTAASMIERAAKPLLAEMNLDPLTDIDILLTNVSVPDEPFLGCGAKVAHQIGSKPKWVIDIHNSGCISSVYMMDIARSLMIAQNLKTALICNVQNAAGQIFSQPQTRKKPQSAVPGDGCGILYLTTSEESPILALVHRCYGEYASDMFSSNDENRKYFDTRTSEVSLEFTEAKIASIISRGNRIVPEIIQEVCKTAEMRTSAIDGLFTNQPNPFFLRNWREAVEVPAEKHFDTFSQYGNLFGAAIPINFDEAVRGNKIKNGSKLVFAGFSHAGDYSAAALIHWKKEL